MIGCFMLRHLCQPLVYHCITIWSSGSPSKPFLRRFFFLPHAFFFVTLPCPSSALFHDIYLSDFSKYYFQLLVFIILSKQTFNIQIFQVESIQFLSYPIETQFSILSQRLQKYTSPIHFFWAVESFSLYVNIFSSRLKIKDAKRWKLFSFWGQNSFVHHFLASSGKTAHHRNRKF